LQTRKREGAVAELQVALLKREGTGLRYMSFLEAMLQRQALRGFGKFW
jgi:hypothetical protein